MPPVVGAPLPRVDGPAKVTGTAPYASDYAPLGLAYCSMVVSSIASGSITRLETDAAEKAAGVLLVLTHRNADRLPYEEAQERPAVDPVSGDQLRVLDGPDVRFAGQPVAVVVAETQEQADHAASLVGVAYDRDPAPLTTFDPSAARPTSAAAEARGRGPETRQGEPDKAMREAAVRVDGTYTIAREQHHPIELHAAIAWWEGDHLTLWSKTQWVGNERDEIARRFGIPSEHVRVINPFVGGAFGNALRSWPHVTLAVMAARRIGRPVRLALTRRQMSFSVGFRGRSEQRVSLAADHDGRLAAMTHDMVGQTSTYEEFAEPALGPAWATYACPNRRTRYRLVEMNVGTPCPMRGPGWATGLVAQEIAMDELADKLRLDPVDLRLRNFAERDPKSGNPWSSNRLRDCYREGAGRFGWSERSTAPASMRAGRTLVGMGMATAIYPAGRYAASASATLYADGRAVVRCATTDMGPGTYTSATQIAADALGLPPDRVRFELGDSALPAAKEHGGSTTLASVGPAVQAACRVVLEKLARLQAHWGGAGGDAADVLPRARLDRLDAEVSVEPDETAKGSQAMHGFGAVFAEVQVDPDTCEIRVSRMIGAYDAGRIVNPMLACSQCIGGMIGGLGMALMEGVAWDARTGRVTNPDLAEYHIPVCADVGIWMSSSSTAWSRP